MLLDEEAAILFSKSQLDNLTEMLKSINIVFPEKYKNNFVKYKKNSDPNKIIYELCLNNANEIFNNKVPVEYKDRIDYEISIISQMGFSDYFLVVQDYVNYAKNNNISVGPGRGSAVGSLVSYLLKITEVDPIKHGLIFERFLNPDRIGMPDIDIDFEDAKRNMVTKYLYDKYGSEHIAHIITFQKMKAKMAIRDVGRVLEMPLIIINSIVKYFGFDNENDIVKAINDSKELKEFNNKYPLLFELSNRILNFPRQVGIHASGVIVSDEPLTNIIPIQTSSDIIYSTQCSMDYLEEMGLIKLDILGLSNLSSISQMIELIHKNYQKNINCLDIPLDDSLIFKKLSNGDTSGIFQLESPGMTNLIIRIKPTSIEDISICSALFRPGPQKNIPTYLFNKQNPNDIVYINDVFKKILSSTYGIIIYQEQVIEIIKEICNFSTAQSDTFRKIISKKQIEKMNKIKDEFISAAINNKYTLDQANEIFNYMYEFANYGFNHAHSIAYSYISY
ncbi:hypothetical protein FACS189459_3250 [Bacilli bacterium]|nr:hypothetical protein FACS189459_3250 [Bacilli bacterium]